MNRAALIILVCGFPGATSFAQGTVQWNTIPAVYMTAQTNTAVSPMQGGTGSGGSVGNVSGSASLGTGFYFELLYSTYTGSRATITSLAQLLLTWNDTGLGATNSPSSPGRLVVLGNQNSTGATVPFTDTENVVLVGWSANLGSSWNVVSNELYNGNISDTGQNFFGFSATGYITPHAPGVDPGVAVFGNTSSSGNLPINSPNTQLYAFLDPLPLPEPATLILAGLGGLPLFLFRHRK